MNVLIIEDEETASSRLQRMLSEIDKSMQVVAIKESIESAVTWIRSNPAPDLILADIHLADGPSFDIFQQVEINSPVIFITAYDQYAIAAFKFNSIDYLLKPVKKIELEQAIAKYKKLYEKSPGQSPIDYRELLAAIAPGKKNFQKRIVIRYGQTIKTVEIADVAYFFTEDKVTFVCTNDNKQLPIDHNLDEIEEIIDPSRFFRINRQFIISIDAIESMHSYSKSRVKINLRPASPTETIVSAERSASFKEWLLGKE
jgi:DNA-binding LytR/AlgR family response regulator